MESVYGPSKDLRPGQKFGANPRFNLVFAPKEMVYCARCR